MKRTLHAIASAPVTLGGFGLLAVVLLAPLPKEWTIAPTVAPLALLVLNLAAALAIRPKLRRGGLGIFHFALLAMLLLAGFGRLVHYDARVEVTEESLLDPQGIEVVSAGPWSGAAVQRLGFRQGSFEVDYAPGMRRAHTRSQTWLPGEPNPRVVGDDTPLVLDGYRFYTTHNKGFAPMLAWQPDRGEAVRGALHMPSYPLFDWKQENTWVAPDGAVLRFWLRIERPLADKSAWTLVPRDMPAVLVVEAAGVRHELKPGESIALPGASLRYERLAGWMGYRIFHDPTIVPLLAAAVLGIFGLAWHLWRRQARPASFVQGVPA
jgi:hypothetical protein